MHRLVHAQRLDIGPVEHVRALPGHLLQVHQRREFDELRARARLQPLDEVAERESDPGDDHRPGLDAAQPIDALLERMRLQEVLERVAALALAFAVDDHGPGPWAQAAGIAGRVVLARAELVEVVVTGDVGQGVGRLARRVARIVLVLQALDEHHIHDLLGARGLCESRGSAKTGNACEKFASGAIDGLRRDLRRSDSHDGPPAHETGAAGPLLRQSATGIPNPRAMRRASWPPLTSIGCSTARRCARSEPELP